MRRSGNLTALPSQQHHRADLQSHDHMDAPRCTNLLAAALNEAEAAKSGSITDVAEVWRSMHSDSGRVPSSTPERSWHPLLLSGGAPICEFLAKKLRQNRGLYTLFLARSVSRKCSCSCSGSCSQPRRLPAATLPRVPCLPRPRRAYAEATANCIRNKCACATTAGARNQPTGSSPRRCRCRGK